MVNLDNLFGAEPFRKQYGSDPYLITAILGKSILDTALNSLKKHNIINPPKRDDIKVDMPKDNEYYKAFNYSYVKDITDTDYAIYSNASLALLIASYAYGNTMLSEVQYNNAADCRYGRRYKDSNHILFNKMYLLYIAKKFDMHSLKDYVYTIEREFYMPVKKYLEKYGIDQEIGRPHIYLLVAYKELLKIETFDKSDCPNGIDVNLPVFLRRGNEFTTEYTPFKVDSNILDYLNKGELVPYELYRSILQSMFDTAHSIS